MTPATVVRHLRAAADGASSASIARDRAYMVTYAVLAVLGLAGYLQAPGWLVLAGAGCLTLDGWRPWRPTRIWGPRSRIDWTSKTTTYFVTGLIVNLIVAAGSFGGGRFVRTLLG